MTREWCEHARRRRIGPREHHRDHDGPGYATPQAAVEEGGRETLASAMSLYVGTGVDAPYFVAVVDLDPDSET